MSVNAVPMPELPGMWFDPSLNRYFKICAEHPPPPPPEPERPRSDAPSAGRLLRARELGRLRAAEVSAALLSRARRRSVPDAHFSGGSVTVHPDTGCAAVLSAAGSVHLRHFPSGGCIDSLFAPEGPPLCMAWSARMRVAALVLRGGARRDKLVMCALPLRGATRALLASEDMAAQASAVALSPLAHPAVAALGATQVFNVRAAGARPVALLRHRDRAPGLAALFPTEQCVVTGTRAGNVYKFDLRKGGRAACTLPRRGEGSAVVGVKGSRDNGRVFVSSMRNCENNLCAFDWRQTGNGPVVTFLGHRNECKRVEFDLDEGASGGLLAAGGDDGVVRFWDCNRGGDALGEVEFGDEIPQRVMLVCWDSQSRVERPRPGMWVVTDKQPYTFEIGTSF